MSAENAFEAAVKLLRAADRSTRALSHALAEKGFDPRDIDQAIERAKSLHLIDDEGLSRSLAEKAEMQGRSAAELDTIFEAKGLTEMTATRVAKEGLFDERKSAMNYLTRKKLQSPKAAAALLRKGFPEDIVRALKLIRED
jgi:regulatory protein